MMLSNAFTSPLRHRKPVTLYTFVQRMIRIGKGLERVVHALILISIIIIVSVFVFAFHCYHKKMVELRARILGQGNRGRRHSNDWTIVETTTWTDDGNPSEEKTDGRWGVLGKAVMTDSNSGQWISVEKRLAITETENRVACS